MPHQCVKCPNCQYCHECYYSANPPATPSMPPALMIKNSVKPSKATKDIADRKSSNKSVKDVGNTQDSKKTKDSKDIVCIYNYNTDLRRLVKSDTTEEGKYFARKFKEDWKYCELSSHISNDLMSVEPPIVRRVFKLTSPPKPSSFNGIAYEDQKKYGSKVVKVWHGSLRDCQLGDSKRHGISSSAHSSLCSGKYDGTCKLCAIIYRGFKKPDKADGVNRALGPGIYQTSNTVKAGSYSFGNIRGRDSRSHCKYFYLLLSKCTMGKVYKTNQYLFEGPPLGYHTVERITKEKPSDKTDYDYPEVAVYSEQRVYPTHLIICRNPAYRRR